ncbi:fibronectin type III domain-containing protein [Amnibacterium sp. CER49]|uniref:fibronectin type III domain-containing protein n=1 Tax=Amnibacterium sp. CER49 TaxID=3039161 RepID=UPI00244D08AE|nr:fibronectin type III domain-containing protein [Amnibacterium sp. CER49]MDH2445118.1 fibronectin type III domain-containing protein [Amnibacterium sp. CER49]
MLVRRLRRLAVVGALLTAAAAALPAAAAGAATQTDPPGSRGPWAYDISVTPHEIDATGGPVTVSLFEIATSSTIDHGPDVWFTKDGVTTSATAATLVSGDTTAGTWIAHPVVPADATGSWSLVIADATTTTGDSGAVQTLPDELRVGFPDPPASVSAVATGVGTHLRLSWPAAHDGGRTITAYRVIGSNSATVTTTPGDVLEADVDVAGQPTGRPPVYTVVSVNAVGLSLPSSPSPLTPAPATVPQAPTGLVGRFGYGTANLSWQPSPHALTSAVTSSVVTLEPGDHTCTTAYLGCSITGLPTDVIYTAVVRSVNSFGPSEPSKPLVLGPPGPVADFSVGIIGTSVNLNWTADPNTADPSTYSVTTDQAGLGCTTKATWCRIDGLEVGRTYRFWIHATDSMGVGATGDPVSATVVDVPAAPPIGTLTRTDTTVTAHWTAADDHGLPLETYVVTATSAQRGTWVDLIPATARSYTFTRLPTGVPFTVTVQAQNNLGEGPETTLGTATLPDPSVVPTAPARPRITVEASSRLTVRWRVVVDDAAPRVDGYELSVLRAGHVLQRIDADAARRIARTMPLPPGRYTVRVRAHNRAGWSPLSLASTAELSASQD